MLPVFDTQRAILLDEPEPDSFTVSRYISLGDALAEGQISPEEQYLLAPLADSAILLPLLAMIYHHVAQGSLANIQWMASFCCLCGAGRIFNARYQEQVFTFAAQGYYDVMILISDKQTQSYWNHLTGGCVHGSMVGASLEGLSPLMQVRAMDVLLTYPNAQIAIIDDINDDTMATANRWNAKYLLPKMPDYGNGLLGTQGSDDSRLRPFEMGLGIWTTNTRRYYPISRLYEAQNVIVDRVDGRGVVIVLNEEVGLPTVFYFEPTGIKRYGQELVLSANARYRNGVLYIDGKPVKAERPYHNTIRWYAFSAIAPGCEIYGHPLPSD